MRNQEVGSWKFEGVMNRAKKILGLFEDDLKDIYGEPVEDEEHYFLKKIDADVYAGDRKSVV